jgi:predicted PurR-regulated permease PerM
MNEPSHAGGRRPKLGRIAAITITIAAILGIAWLAVELAGFLLLVFASLVIAAVFDASARQVTRFTRLGHGLSLTISILGLLAVFLGGFVMFGSQLANQFDTIRDSIPPALDQVEAFLDRAGLGEPARELMDQGSGDVSRLAAQAGGYLLSAGSSVANFLLVFVGAIFIASDPAVYRRGLLLMMPRCAEETAGHALDDAARGLRGWMVGQGVSSLAVATASWAGLALLGVPASGGLGLLAGLLDVIPMIGPIIAAVPAVLLAFTVSPGTALWTVGLFVVVQQLQSYVLLPMIQKHAVNVPPAVLLFAVVAFGLLFGFIGVLLAAPLTVVTYVMIQRVYVRTLLGKDIRIAGED